jgi:choline dehydrogenase-like flavoprotein
MDAPNIDPQRKTYDAIVVGSGITGGWAAKEFAEKGLDTLVLERGRNVTHGEDYVTEHKPSWEMDFHGQGSEQEFQEHYPRQSMAGPFNAYNKHFFVKDSKYPYAFDEEEPFLWVRGYHLGGRSITWGRQCYRWSDLDFTANARDGVGIDWPIRYADIAPWYDYVEEFAGISGREEGLPQLPDGQFQPPMEMNAGEKKIKAGLEDAYDDRLMTIGRSAVLTEPKPDQGRAACHYCGPCARGCTVGAYFSSLSSTLPAARETGNMTLQCNSIVHSVKYDAETGRASGVRVINRKTKKTREYEGRVVFLCASALGSTKILLNSTSSRFPNGLANSSGTLGQGIMDHHFKVGASGTIPGLEDRYYYGDRPNGIYIPRFRNLGGQDDDVDFLRGYGYQGGAYREGWTRALGEEGFGASLKHKLRDPGQWRMYLGAFGEMLPDTDNYVELDDETDEWGIPLLRTHVSLSENAEAMREDMKQQAAEMLEAAGATEVSTYEQRYWPGEGIHEMGGARMGRDPDTSVLNGNNQAHDVPNLFVTDGACMTSAGWQNPSITYMALTARAVNYAVNEMKRDNL